MSTPIPVFGTAVPGVDYVNRPGVYGFAFDTFGRVLVVHGRWGCFLPGGGAEDGESDLECLVRELKEELGAGLTASSFLCEAVQNLGPYADGNAWRKRERFYQVTLDRIINEPFCEHHTPEWLMAQDAQEKLSEECQVWAVGQALKRFEKAG